MTALAAVTLALGIMAGIMGGAFCFAGLAQASQSHEQEIPAPEKRAAILATFLGMVLCALPFASLIFEVLLFSTSAQEAREWTRQFRRAWDENPLVRRLLRTGGWCLAAATGLLLASAMAW